MRRLAIVSVLSLAAASAFAQTKEPIASARHGLVPCRRARHRHHRPADQGGRVHARRRAGEGRPNGKYQVEQMYVQYFLPQNRKGRLPLLAVARRRAHRRHLRDQARRRRRAGSTISSARAGTPTSPTRSSAAAPAGPALSRASRWPAAGRSLGALSHRSGRLVERRQEPSARPIRARNSRSRPTSNS